MSLTTRERGGLIVRWKNALLTWEAYIRGSLFTGELIYGILHYDKLYPSGSAPSRIYGTPKMQKFSSSDSFPKLRPIVSSIGTFNYNLACFFYDLLSPLVPKHYPCKDTFYFVSKIKNTNISKKILASYDVTSLFTNIPLHETIDIAINLIFSHNPNLNIT